MDKVGFGYCLAMDKVRCGNYWTGTRLGLARMGLDKVGFGYYIGHGRGWGWLFLVMDVVGFGCYWSGTRWGWLLMVMDEAGFDNYWSWTRLGLAIIGH